ncbi:DUF5078 domain-containing protein [Mycobacterium sp. BMJ-28]
MTCKRISIVLRSAVAALTVAGSIAAGSGVAAADATDDYPIPNRMLKTTCTAEQIMAAARDVKPMYYERYMIDYNNKSPEVQRATRDRIHWFYSLDYAGRRTYSETTATNAFYEQLSWNWPNWAKLFFNNKGVAAATTDTCNRYQPADHTVWTW